MSDNNSLVIKSSKIALLIRILIAGLLVILLCFFVSIVFIVVLNLSSNFAGYTLLTLWILLPGIWVIGSLLAYKRSLKSSYVAQNDALKVVKPKFPGTDTEYYRYDSIITISFYQSFFGKKFDYGNIVIHIPKLDKKIILQNVISPAQQTSKLNSIASKKTNSTQSLIT